MTSFETRRSWDTANDYQVRVAGHNSPIEGPQTVVARGLGLDQALFLTAALNRKPRTYSEVVTLLDDVTATGASLSEVLHAVMPPHTYAQVGG